MREIFNVKWIWAGKFVGLANNTEVWVDPEGGGNDGEVLQIYKANRREKWRGVECRFGRKGRGTLSGPRSVRRYEWGEDWESFIPGFRLQPLHNPPSPTAICCCACACAHWFSSPIISIQSPQRCSPVPTHAFGFMLYFGLCYNVRPQIPPSLKKLFLNIVGE